MTVVEPVETRPERHAAWHAATVAEAHHGVNSLVTNFRAALYRDFPDPQRVIGEERF